jgi:hypothetical protein
MKAIVTQIRLQFTESGNTEIVLTTTAKMQQETAELKSIITNGKQLTCEVKQYRQRRSLDANSYCWVIISKIVDVIRTNKDDLYIEMLKRYGQREPKLISVVSDAVDIIYRATQNHCCEVGESELNGKVFKHLAILIGSSQYDSKSMAVLIDGIVSEAKELDIETMPPAELAGLKEEWGR